MLYVISSYKNGGHILQLGGMVIQIVLFDEIFNYRRIAKIDICTIIKVFTIFSNLAFFESESGQGKFNKQLRIISTASEKIYQVLF